MPPTPSFADHRFMSAAEKTQVYRAWIKFLKHGCDPRFFTKALYHHLTQHASFIAHYDKYGFIDTYFTRPADTLTFLTQFWTGRSVEYGYTIWLEDETAGDLNRALCAVARHAPRPRRSSGPGGTGRHGCPWASGPGNAPAPRPLPVTTRGRAVMPF